MGCSVDYEPPLGYVEFEDHDMFKVGGRGVPDDTKIVWGWMVIADQDWTERFRVTRRDVMAKKMGWGGEPRMELGRALISSSRRTWRQPGGKQPLKKSATQRARGKCSKKEAVDCDTGGAQTSKGSRPPSNYQYYCKLQ